MSDRLPSPARETSVPDQRFVGRRPWWDRLLCRIGCHDWREMNGRCRSCGSRDDLWEAMSDGR